MNGKDTKFALALVTGATRGIGEEFCRLLAARKIPMIIVARDANRLKEVASELSKSVSVMPIAADLGTSEGRKKITEVIREHVPDLVVNNAGFGLYGEAIDLPIDQQLQMVDVDIKAVLELSLEAARALQALGKEGTILNVASAAAFLVFPLFATYSASKAFVVSFSESLDFELAPHRIRVLASCPGVVKTDFRERAGGKYVSEPMMTTTFAAEQLWHQIVTGRRVHIFDWKMRLGVFLGRYLIPKALLAKILTRSIRQFKS